MTDRNAPDNKPRPDADGKPAARGTTPPWLPGAKRPAPAAGTASKAKDPRPVAARGAHATAQRSVSVPLWAIATAGAAVLALAIAVALLSARSCVPTTQRIPVAPQEWVSPYDWSNVRELDNGLLAYYVDGQLASEAGVDVSEHDGEIDWAAVKASGVDFAMIRLGYRGYSQGSLVLDSYFLANIQGAYEAGLKVGAYFFSQAITDEEAREEARYVIDTLAGLSVELSYPVAFDQEPISGAEVTPRTEGLSDEQLSANALAFCQTIEQAGYQAMVYGNQHDLAKLDLAGALAAYPVWYAEYETGTEPTGQVTFAMWQYSATGTVEGIPSTAGQVDLNIRFLTQ